MISIAETIPLSAITVHPVSPFRASFITAPARLSPFAPHQSPSTSPPTPPRRIHKRAPSRTHPPPETNQSTFHSCTMSNGGTVHDAKASLTMDHITTEQASIIERLYDIGALKLGKFKLKSGVSSPVYIDLRLTVSHPDLLRDICGALSDKVKHVPHDLLCGVPYTAIPFATAMSLSSGKPMLMRRKEAKEYGTKRLIEGVYQAGQTVMIVEDLVTSGLSVMETVAPLRDFGLHSNHVVVVLDREQGAEKNLSAREMTLHSLFTLTDMLAVLLDKGKIEPPTLDSVLSFIHETQVTGAAFSEKAPPVACEQQTEEIKTMEKPDVSNGSEKDQKNEKENATEELKVDSEAGGVKPKVSVGKEAISKATYAERSALAKHPVAKRLFELMESKQSNLAVAADVSTASALLELAEQVGPHIAILKTHADIVSDWTDATASGLRDIAKRHHFLIFEDRKFADIGNTTYNQVSAGVHRIAGWADIVNAHAVAGDGVVAGLAKAADAAGECGWQKFGVLLLAQMSSKGNLASGLEGYTQKTVDMALRNREHVFGFISMEKIAGDEFVYMTPGVNLEEWADGLGQQYSTPDAIVVERGSDVIIVGRGVFQAEDKAAAAKKYRHAGWKAYEKRTSGIN